MLLVVMWVNEFVAEDHNDFAIADNTIVFKSGVLSKLHEYIYVRLKL